MVRDCILSGHSRASEVLHDGGVSERCQRVPLHSLKGNTLPPHLLLYDASLTAAGSEKHLLLTFKVTGTPLENFKPLVSELTH